MQADAIAACLQPFLGGDTLSPIQLNRVSLYLELLLKWNARINLTAVRQAEDMVSRHFGESFFAARELFPAQGDCSSSVADVGSGAGFPGLPIKIFRPALSLTLIESNHKKAAFQREVVRVLALEHVEVLNVRAEECPAVNYQTVIMRAVEKFTEVLSAAARLVRPGGRIALLIGESQTRAAHASLPGWSWQKPLQMPHSEARVLLVGEKPQDKD